MDGQEASDPNLQESQEQQEEPRSSSELDDSEFSNAQTVGCLVSFGLVIILLIAPKVFAIWQGLSSDGTWVYPPIGVLVFWFLSINALFTGKIPYRSKDLDVREYPIAQYSIVGIFALAAAGMYLLYLAMVFQW